MMISSKLRKYYVPVLILVVLFLTIPAVMGAKGLFTEIYSVNIALHSIMEALGGSMSLFITILIVNRYSKSKEETDYPLLGMAFLVMGVFDIYHSLLPEGNSFVLSHLTSVSFGGFWFGSIILPQEFKSLIRKKTILVLVVLVWIISLVVMTLWTEKVPVTFVDGDFTQLAKTLNAFASVGFLLGSLKLFFRFRRTFEKEIFLFIIYGLIQGLSRFTFLQSAVWGHEWWIWHVLRFIGSSVLFYSVWSYFSRIVNDLEVNNRNQQFILDAMPFGLMIIGKDKIVKQINKAAQKLTEFSPEDVLGKDCSKSICPQDCEVCPFLEDKDTIRNSEKSINSANGKMIPVLKSVVPIVLNNEEVLLEGFVDISETIEAQNQLKNTLIELEQSNSVLKQFAYASAHDLQEPLRKMKNYSDLLNARYSDTLDKRGNKYIDSLSKGTLRMQILIQNLLEYSTIATREKKPKRVNTKQLVKNTLDLYRPLLKEKNAEINIGMLPAIEADPYQMEIVIRHLIENAIKFNDKEKPLIKIDSIEKNDYWEIRIVDNGIGIDSSYSDKIFQVFQQLHAKDKFQGTGLGLAMCKKIIENHKGSIWFESDPGRETSFCFTIPKGIDSDEVNISNEAKK